LSIESDAFEVASVAAALDDLIANLSIVENRARIVAGTKTLHHLLPDLVPPMDRALDGTFFGWSSSDPQNNQTKIFVGAFTGFAEVARATQPSRLVGDGWRSCSTKVLDNAVIGIARPTESADRVARDGGSRVPGCDRRCRGATATI
jgi:hypothetical protein